MELRHAELKAAMANDSSADFVTTPAAPAPPTHATVLPATTPMPISQAHAADAAAMAHDGEAEAVITPAAPAPTAHATPPPADWATRSKSGKKHWMQAQR